MEVKCDHCGHKDTFPDDVLKHMYPPKGTVRMISYEGCSKCGDGRGGEFCWQLEDGTLKGCLAGRDELEDQGIPILNTR